MALLVDHVETLPLRGVMFPKILFHLLDARAKEQYLSA